MITRLFPGRPPGARPGGSPPGRIWFAQALRAVACLMVVATHYMDSFVAAHPGIAQEALFPPLTALPRPAYCDVFLWMWVHLKLFPGGFGVALFFLVSGFVIPFSLERGGLRGFVVRRFCRLYPTYWASLALILAVLAFQAGRHHLAFPHPPAVVASNAFLVHPYLGYPGITGVLWTLVVEEFFYALAAVGAWRRLLDKPLAVLLAGVGLTGVALACSPIALTPAAPVWQAAFSWVGWNASFVVFIFVGVVLHFLYRGAWRPRVGLPLIFCLLALFALCFCRGAVGRVADFVPLVSSLAALAVFAPLCLLNRRLPYSRWVDWLAEVSYPLYLVHAPLGYIVIRSVFMKTGNLYLGCAAAFLVVLAPAALLHRFVEKPSIQLGRRLAARVAGGAVEAAAPRRAA